ncbi:MAG: type II toxin-antitoxin system YhaV family toxin [Cyanobacteria bacterium J06648_10]
MEGLNIHGWTVLAHDCLLTQFEELVEAVDRLRQKSPDAYQRKNVTKRLEAVTKLAFNIIPQDPTREIYRQGGTLGAENKHWFRSKFYQQYRLFFRYHMESKIIVLGWVNDPTTKRAHNSKKDAYKVFEKMLEGGHPPSEWKKLLAEAQAENERFKNIVEGL